LKDKIMNRIQEHYDAIKSDKYDILGIFLYGSQNYGLEYEGSDIDTKAIVIPNFDDFVNSRKPISKTVKMDNGDQIDVKDIRVMFDNFLKQNINFIEILFTEYKIINPKYKDIFQIVIDKNEEISKYNIYKTLNCISGMSMQKLKALEHPYPSIKDKIDKYNYDPKQLHHIIRLNEFIKKYVWGYSYKDCLKSNMKEYLINVKSYDYYKLEDARKIAKATDKETKFIKDDYLQNNKLIVNKDIEKLFENVVIESFKKKFRGDLKYE